MQVKVNYEGKFRFEAIAREHLIRGDQPRDNDGEDTGMTPPEWFLASLGSCVGFYAVKYCQSRGLDATGLSIDVSAQKTHDPPTRLDDIQIHLHLPIALDTHHREGLEKAVDACLIHKTLTHPPKITTEITTALKSAT